MDDSFSFKNIIIPTAILLDSQLLMGQQPALVESAEADQNYTNTTIVYKQKDADDALVLLSLGQNYGTGSVVRIAVSDLVPQQAEVKSPVRPEAVSDENAAPASTVEAPKSAKSPDISTKILVEKSPQPTAATEKSIAEKRANGLKSPAPKPVKMTGKIYDPQKKSLLDRLQKIHLPDLNFGSRVRCPSF